MSQWNLIETLPHERKRYQVVDCAPDGPVIHIARLTEDGDLMADSGGLLLSVTHWKELDAPPDESTPPSPAAGEQVEGLTELRALAEKATPGPWDTIQGGTVRALKGDFAVPIFRSYAPIDWHKKKNLTHAVMCAAYADEVNNALFIAACRDGVPTLFAEIDRQAAALTALTAENKQLRESRDDYRQLLADERENSKTFLIEQREVSAAFNRIVESDASPSYRAANEIVPRLQEAERQRDELREALNKVNKLLDDSGMHWSEPLAEIEATIEKALSTLPAEQKDVT